MKMVSTGLFRPAEHFYPANFHLQNLILLVLLEAIESTKCIDYYFAKLCVLMDRRFSTLIVCWLVITYKEIHKNFVYISCSLVT